MEPRTGEEGIITGPTLRWAGSLQRHRLLVLVSLTVAMVLGLAVSAERSAAEPADRSTIFVVDTSTSMYGEPLAEAKRALLGAGPAIPSETHVALRSFGGPCDDGGVSRLPLGPFDQGAFNAAVESLKIGASGTPTPAALRAAGATLPDSGDRTIVLISDGGSSCGNPCPVARELSDRLGVGFRVDAVGFRAPDSAESELDCVARVTGGSYVSVKNSAGLQKAVAESTAARVTGLRLSPTTLAAAAKGASIGRVARGKVGTRVRYTLSEGAKVRFTVERAAQGRRVRGKCRKPTARTRRARRCTRYVKLPGSFTHDGRQGTNRFGFRGRLRGKKLRPGRYRLVATATDAAGNTAKPSRAKFKVVRR